MTGALFVLMIIACVVSTYFSYVGGVMGKPETRLLHPLSLGAMVLSLGCAAVLSLRLDVWNSWIIPESATVITFICIAAAPFFCYSLGQDEKEKRTSTVSN